MTFIPPRSTAKYVLVSFLRETKTLRKGQSRTVTEVVANSNPRIAA
ncbi:MAG: hypothetical protein RR330_03390 [Alistipes sp.]